MISVYIVVVNGVDTDKVSVIFYDFGWSDDMCAWFVEICLHPPGHCADAKQAAPRAL